MHYVMGEITNFRQIDRLKPDLVQDLRKQLEQFALNRGGKLLKEQSGYFLFGFNPLRERALSLVSDFLSLSVESLEKRQSEIFGYSFVLETDPSEDIGLVFPKMRNLLFLTQGENKLWMGSDIKPLTEKVFQSEAQGELWEITGSAGDDQQDQRSFGELLELTGWVEALKKPLENLISGAGGTSRILRIKGQNLPDKALFLQLALEKMYPGAVNFPLVFPLDGSKDFLSQLLAARDPEILAKMETLLGPEDRALWQAQPQAALVLQSQGGAAYPGDCPQKDSRIALRLYLLALIEDLKNRGLPPIFVFLSPGEFPEEAVDILEDILPELLQKRGLYLLVLEAQNRKNEFLDRLSSLTWFFPPLTWPKIQAQAQEKGITRLPQDPETLMTVLDDWGTALAHEFFALQDHRFGDLPLEPGVSPSWTLLQKFDVSHRKIYLIYLMGRELLTQRQLIDFFQFLGEDPAVIQDKVNNLKDLGFMVFGKRNLALREDFLPLLQKALEDQAPQLCKKFADFIYGQWENQGRELSEVVFEALIQTNQEDRALPVLAHYFNQKINRNQGDFTALLKQRGWTENEDRIPWKKRTLVITSAARLRHALNQGDRTWDPKQLRNFTKNFPETGEELDQGLWVLELGRYHLKSGNWTEGFTLLKKAFLQAQEQRDALLEIRCSQEIAQALMIRHRVDEAREYLEMSWKNAEKRGHLYNYVVGAALEASNRVLWGSLSGAIKIVDKVLPVASEAGMQSYRTFLQFLRGRSEWELGSYAEAQSWLKQARESALRYEFRDAALTVARWEGRALVYEGRIRQGIDLLLKLPEGAERNFFLSEAYYLSHDWEKALEAVTRAKDFLTPVTNYYGERVPWDTGFSGVEDRVAGPEFPEGVLGALVRGFGYFLEAKYLLKPESQQELYQMLGQKNRMEVDPYSHWYFLWYFLLMPNEKDLNEALRSTILGRGLKDLQTRGSRIEDRDQRVQFLTRPYWCQLFFAEAKKLKLV